MELSWHVQIHQASSAASVAPAAPHVAASAGVSEQLALVPSAAPAGATDVPDCWVDEPKAGPVGVAAVELLPNADGGGAVSDAAGGSAGGGASLPATLLRVAPAARGAAAGFGATAAFGAAAGFGAGASSGAGGLSSTVVAHEARLRHMILSPSGLGCVGSQSKVVDKLVPLGLMKWELASRNETPGVLAANAVSCLL